MPNLITKHIQISKVNNRHYPYRWHFSYLHGNVEFDFNDSEDENVQVIPDIFYSDTKEPDFEGHFIAYIENEPVLLHLVYDEYGRIQGRGCYLDDKEALEHVLKPEYWA